MGILWLVGWWALWKASQGELSPYVPRIWFSQGCRVWGVDYAGMSRDFWVKNRVWGLGFGLKVCQVFSSR